MLRFTLPHGRWEAIQVRVQCNSTVIWTLEGDFVDNVAEGHRESTAAQLESGVQVGGERRGPEPEQ